MSKKSSVSKVKGLKVKVPESPSVQKNHDCMNGIVTWMSDRVSSSKSSLNSEEKLNLFRFGVKSFNRYKSLVSYLWSWVQGFSCFTDKVQEALRKSKAPADITFIIYNWFIAFNEVQDEFLLLKFGGITSEYDLAEHQFFLVKRNLASSETFPNQQKFENFTACSFFGYRDLTTLIHKVSTNISEKWEDFLLIGGEESVEKMLTNISSALQFSLENLAKEVDDLVLVEKSHFFPYSQTHHSDSTEVYYRLTVDNEEIDVNKALLPTRTDRSLCYYIKTVRGRVLGSFKIDQDVTCAIHSSPDPGPRFLRRGYIQIDEDPNDLDEVRDSAVLVACTKDEKEEEEEEEEVVVEPPDISNLSVTNSGGSGGKKSTDSAAKVNKGSGHGSNSSSNSKPSSFALTIVKSGTVSAHESRVNRQKAAAKNGRPVEDIYGPSSMTNEDLMMTPNNSGVPLQPYSSNKYSSNGVNSALFNNSEDELDLIDANDFDEEEDSDTDSDEDEMEADCLQTAYSVGTAISQKSHHASRGLRNTSEITVFDIHDKITGQQVRTELFHAVMGKMMANARVVSSIAGYYMQNPNEHIDWLKEAAIIKSNVCNTLDFAPPVRKKDFAKLTATEQERQIVSQDLGEKLRNNKLNKQANRATFQVLKLVIETAEVMKANPEFKPPIIDSNVIQLWSDEEKGMHYLQHALYLYPEEDFEVMKSELARVEKSASNLAVSIPAAKVKAAKKYAGNWKGIDNVGSSSSSKKRKRVAADKDDGELSASAKKAVKEAESKVQKDLDAAKKEADAAKKQTVTLQRELAATRAQAAEDAKRAFEEKKKAADDAEKASMELQRRAKEESDRKQEQLRSLEDKLATAAKAPPPDVVSSSTPSSSPTSAVTTPGSVDTSPSKTAQDLEETNREIADLERAIARRDQLKGLLAGDRPLSSRPSSSQETMTFRQSSSQAVTFFSSVPMVAISSVVVPKDVSVPVALPSADDLIVVLREKAAPLSGYEFNFSWFLDSFLSFTLGKTSPSLPAILSLVDRSDWDSCVADAKDILSDNKILISRTDGTDGLMVDETLEAKDTNSNMLLALFACTSLEHDLIKGILFKLLHTIYNDGVLNCRMSYVGNEFVIKKRGDRFDHKLCSSRSFSFFHTAEYHTYLEGEFKRLDAEEL